MAIEEAMKRSGGDARKRSLFRSVSTIAVSMALVMAPAAPLTAAAVSWVPDADGFWDVPANWNLGLPGAADDVTISVSGATVRTITYRTGTVTVNTLASDEDLLVTGGNLTVSNGYTNTRATRLQGGTLTLNAPATMASFAQTGGNLVGTGVVTVSGASTLSNATQTGAGQTLFNGTVALGSFANSLDDGRLLEFHGGVTTDTNFRFDLNPSGPGTSGILRNAESSVFVDSSIGSSTTIGAAQGGGSFQNLGTYRKTGANTTGVSTAFTNSGTLDLDAGIFQLSGTSSVSGTVDLASGAVLSFNGGSHGVSGATFIGSSSGIVRLASTTVTINDATSLPTLQLQGGSTLAGTGVVTAGTASINGATLLGSGQLIIEGPASLGNFGASLDDGRLLEFRGGVTTTDTNFIVNLNPSGPGSSGTLRNAAGSVFVDSTTGSLATIGATQGGGSFQNLGTYRKTGANTTSVSVAFTNSGTVQVEAGTFRMSNVVTGASGTTLTGGTWNVIGSAGGSTIDFDPASGMTSLVTNAADIRLAGANSDIVSGAANTGIQATLITNSAAGALRIGSGRSYVATAGGGAFINAGLLELQGGSFGAASLANSGTVRGNGTVNVAVTNTGTVRATGGTLTTLGINGSGTILVDTGATLDASSAAGNLSAGTLTHNGASLNLGARSLVVTNDYQNAVFGTGNAFNGRANVAGTGAINAASATQDLSSAGLSGNTLTVGNVRIGGSSVTQLTVTNNGTSTVLRGAVQNGSAPGVTLSNADFVLGPNGGSATATIGFTASTAGSLAGQTINVVNNFNNVAAATLNLAGAAYNAATATVTPDPINIGNVRVGGPASGAFTIANTAPAGAFSEGLRVLRATTTNGVTVSGITAGVIAAGSSDSASVALSTATAGARSGSVVLGFATNGTGTSGLAEAEIAGASVTINANVYALANPGLNPSLAFGNVRVGDTASRNFLITNAALADVPAGFQEGLNASIASTPAGFTGSGSINNLAAGGASSVAFALDTATAGARTGNAAILLSSNGTGTSGLASVGLDLATVALFGGVFNSAVGNVTPAQINVGNVRVGGTAGGIVLIANTAGAGAFSERLAVTGTSVSGGASITGVTTGLIAAGSSDLATVSLSTATAGARSGTVNFGFATDGTGTSGLAAKAIAGDSVTINANVFALANAGVAPSLAFGNVRVGDTASQSLVITNAALADVPVGFQESLNASITSTPAGFTGNGSISGIAAGGFGSVTIALDTATAGARSGNAVVALASNGTGTSGLATLGLAPANVALSGAVFNSAVGAVSPDPINLGNVRVGGTASGIVTIANTAAAGAFSEGLAVTGTTVSGGASIAGVPSGLIAAGGSDTATVSLSTAIAGARSGMVNFNFATDGTGSSGLAAKAIAGDSVTVNANVFALANPFVTNALQFGNVQQGSVQTRSITVENRQLEGVLAAFQEGLNAGIGLISGDIHAASGSIVNLAAGGTDTTTLTVRLSTGSAGTKSGTVEILLQSNGTGTSGLGNLDLPAQTVAVLGQVEAEAVVFRLAEATLAPTNVAFGSRRIGDAAPTQLPTITNSAAADGFSERLDAVAGATTGRATVAGGPVSLLAAGSGSNALSVGVDTSVAGANGTVTINFASNGAGTSGFGTTALPAQVVTLGGAVYQAAVAGDQPAAITLAARRVGDAAAASNLTIANIAPGTGGFTETLATTGTASNGFTANGNAQFATGGLAAGASQAVAISRGSETAGAFTGTIAIANTSLAMAGSGLDDLALAGQSVSVNANVYAAAVASVGAATVDFGSVRQGAAAPTVALGIANTASGGLTDSLVTSIDSTPAGVSGTAPAALAAGASGDAVFTLATATAGILSGNGSLGFVSANPDMADLALPSQTIAFVGTITELARADLFKAGGSGNLSGSGNAYTLNFGSIRIGSGSVFAEIGVLNGIAASGYSESLGGGFVLTPGAGYAFTGNDFAGLAGGSSNIGNLLSFDFGGLSAGVYSTTLIFNGFSRYAGLADQALGPLELTVTTRIAAVPEPAIWAQLILGFGAIGGLVRRRRTLAEKAAAC